MEKACFYGVSVGPGDPQLLTFRAAGVIAACPVIAAPQTKGENRTALQIARQAVSLEGKEILVDRLNDREEKISDALYIQLKDILAIPVEIDTQHFAQQS